MKKSEFDTCAKNGVSEILEIKIGYDGLTVAENKTGKLSALTRKDIYLALAKTVPGPNGTMIPNPYKTWRDVNPTLPNVKIEVYGPPPTSGTRDSFHELYMEAGCELENKKACHAIREDGVYVEAGENDNLIAQKLASNTNALGIFGYSFLEENLNKLKGLKIEGVSPTFDTISDGTYPASRPLFVYIKKAHVGAIPGLREFADEYVSIKALGEEGYLSERGLVSLDKAELAISRQNVKVLKNFSPK
jgi:phosphate transport system substrate-binding protein